MVMMACSMEKATQDYSYYNPCEDCAYYNPASSWTESSEGSETESSEAPETESNGYPVQVTFSGAFDGDFSSDDLASWMYGNAGTEGLDFTDDEGGIHCRVEWTTSISKLDPADANCPSCQAAWDVNCWNGRTTGDCVGLVFVDSSASAQFRLAFIPDGPGSTTGTVYSADPGSSSWFPYAPATYANGQLDYEDSYRY